MHVLSLFRTDYIILNESFIFEDEEKIHKLSIEISQKYISLKGFVVVKSSGIINGVRICGSQQSRLKLKHF